MKIKIKREVQTLLDEIDLINYSNIKLEKETIRLLMYYDLYCKKMQLNSIDWKSFIKFILDCTRDYIKYEKDEFVFELSEGVNTITIGVITDIHYNCLMYKLDNKWIINVGTVLTTLQYLDNNKELLYEGD